MKKKLILLTLLTLFLLPFVLGEVQTIGPFEKNECVYLKQTCSNCSYVNITSLTSPISEEILSNVMMTKTGSVYNYTFCSTDLIGDYIVNGIADVDGEDIVWAYSFNITPSGKIFHLGDVLTYLLFIIICLGFLFLSIKLISYNSTITPKTDYELYQIKSRSESKYYIELFKSKVWILGTFGVYIFLLMFITLFNQLVYSLDLSELNIILKYVVILLSWGLIPFILFWIVYIIIFFWKTTEKIMRYQFGGFMKNERY